MFVVFTTSEQTFVSMPVSEISRIEWAPPACRVFDIRGNKYVVHGELRRVDSFIESINAAVAMIRKRDADKMQKSGEEPTTQVVVKHRGNP